MTSPTLFESVGVARVTGSWGWFLDQVQAGRHLLLTYHQGRGRGSGRRLVSEPRCVAVPPGFYAAHATEVPGVEVERYASSQGRRDFPKISRRVQSSDHGTHPVHAVFAVKRQEAYTRSVTNSDKVSQVTHPASEGTEVAVLVNIDWYCHVTGVDRELLVAGSASAPGGEK